MEKFVAFIQNTHRIPADKAAEIVACFEEHTYNKGDYFLKEGAVSNEYMFLLQGTLRGFVTDMDGNEVTTSIYTANNVVFEVSSFFSRVPSVENIQCITACTGLVIRFDALNKLFHELPEFREFGRALLVKGYAMLKRRMLESVTLSAEERYLALLQNNPEIFRDVPLKMVASYLGITDTSLSRIRKELAHK